MNQRKPPRDRRRSRLGGRPAKPALQRARRSSGEAPIWLYGVHAVIEALANPRRRCRRLMLGTEPDKRHGARLRGLLAERASRNPAEALSPETVPAERFARTLAEGAVHQGLALLVEPLAQPSIGDLVKTPECEPPAEELPGGRAERFVVVVLDQVTDPRNVGAVLRSAAAFGARALITTRAHAPPESGALARAASGALEHVPYLQVGNLVRTLDSLKAAEFWCLALTSEADRTLVEADPGGSVALVLGAEGAGLRRLTRETCDVMARLPTRAPIDALNVSNAAAAALYELLGRGHAGGAD